MKFSDTIESYISGDWGEEFPSEESPISVHCIRSADIVPYYNNIFDGIPVRYVSERSFNSRELSIGDIVIEKSGGTNDCSTGRVMYVSKELLESNTPLLCSNFCSAFKVKKDWNPKYIYYFLRLVHKSGIFHNFEGKTSGIHNLQMEAAFDAIQIEKVSLEKQNKVVELLDTLERKITINRGIIKELESISSELFAYWFLQFDFPNENGHPYQSSGGKMVYNSKIKRDIPEGWLVISLPEIAVFTNGIACQKFRPVGSSALPVIKIREMRDGFTKNTEFVREDIPEKVKVYNGDILFSWSASLEVMLWAYGIGGLNQHIFKVTSNNGWPKSFYYHHLLLYVGIFKKMAEARKTTMGHITQEHLEQSQIVVPPSIDIALKFDEKVAPILDRIVTAFEEISLLNKQREELLPLLLNGQIKIN